MSLAENARARGTATWPLTAALAVLILVACTCLAPVLRGGAWWFALAFVTVAVLFSAAALRRVGFRLPPLGASAVLLGLVTLVFGGGTGFLGIIPTADTLDRFTVLVRAGFRSIQQQSAPAVAEEGIVFLLVCAVGVVAVAMEFLAVGRRLPAVAASPLLVVVVLPGLIVQGGAGALSLVLTACAFLLLLAVDVRQRRLPAPDAGPGVPASAPVRGTAVVVGGFGVVTALVLSSSMAGLAQGAPNGNGPAGLLFGSGVRTMIDLGDDLRRPDAVLALHYSTNASEPPYLKLLTLDTFQGATWTASESTPEPENTPEFIPRPPGLSSEVETATTKTSIVVDGVRTKWLPAPSPATRVEGLRGTWKWNSDTGAIGSTRSTTSGQDYSVTALQLLPTAEQLRRSDGAYPRDVLRYLDLPSQYPAIIHDTAVTVTGGSGSSFDAAVALQDYLRGSEFTYDTDAPVSKDYDGAGAEVIAAFLEAKRGYCVHFASAMAVMARTLGIPSRVVVGYLPGTREANYGEGARRFNVTSHDLHSWPELYFTGVGWVPFEPTPGRGAVPEYATPETSTTGIDPGTGLPSSAARPTDDPTADDPTAASGAAAVTDTGIRAGDLALVLALAVILALVPGSVRALRGARRRRALRTGTAGPDIAWLELRDTALDHGIPFPETETPREQAARMEATMALSGEPDPAWHEALRRLLSAQERASYARPQQGAGDRPRLVRDLDIVTAGISAQAGRQGRWRARMLPASLWPLALSGKREVAPRRL